MSSVFKCNLCDIEIKPRTLKAHVNEFHKTPDGKYVCTGQTQYCCVERFETYSYDSFQQHVRFVHGNLRSKCAKCFISFGKPYNLHLHEKSCYNLVPVKQPVMKKCLLCDREYADKSFPSHAYEYHRNEAGFYVCGIASCTVQLTSGKFLREHINRSIDKETGKVHGNQIENTSKEQKVIVEDEIDIKEPELKRIRTSRVTLSKFCRPNVVVKVACGANVENDDDWPSTSNAENSQEETETILKKRPDIKTEVKELFKSFKEADTSFEKTIEQIESEFALEQRSKLEAQIEEIDDEIMFEKNSIFDIHKDKQSIEKQISDFEDPEQEKIEEFEDLQELLIKRDYELNQCLQKIEEKEAEKLKVQQQLKNLISDDKEKESMAEHDLSEQEEIDNNNIMPELCCQTFDCDFCGEICASDEDLEYHMKIHTKNQVYTPKIPSEDDNIDEYEIE